MGYADFLATKTRTTPTHGVTVGDDDINPILHDWQRRIVAWAVAKGRAALWETTGAGKTFQAIEWARLSAGPNGRALIVGPLAVCQQTVREAAKLGVPASYVRNGDDVNGPGLWVTNYEMVDHFNPHTFDAMVLDESNGWTLWLGDSCERMSNVPNESVDLNIMSPPFDSLYTYSPSMRDLGNSASREEFFAHYGFIIRELYRITKPGRMACIHVMDLSTTKATHGVTGLTDFSGQVIAAHVQEGWTFVGRITIRKNPQAAAQRTKAQGLMFTTLKRDRSMTRPVHPDYMLLFRKPGENTVPINSDEVDNDTWIQWAEAIWDDIRETDTLNVRVARDDADERHICPLALPLVERCVRLWSNPGELVFSPFAGIGSEVWSAVKFGRRGLGIELKPSYWKTAVDNLRQLESEIKIPALFE